MFSGLYSVYNKLPSEKHTQYSQVYNMGVHSITINHEHELDTVGTKLGLLQMDVGFQIANSCGQSIYLKEEKCEIPSKVIKKCVLGQLEDELIWCRQRFRNGESFKLKIDMEKPLKRWYSSQKGIWLPNLVDAKGASITISWVNEQIKPPLNVCTSVPVAPKLLWNKITSGLTVKRRSLNLR